MRQIEVASGLQKGDKVVTVGGQGVLIADFEGQWDQATSGAVLGDGSLLITGYAITAANDAFNGALLEAVNHGLSSAAAASLSS